MATLDALYPSHGAYVRRVAQAAAAAHRSRWITAEDRARFVSEAARSRIGERR